MLLTAAQLDPLSLDECCLPAPAFCFITAAQLDPLGLDERPKIKELDPAFYGFTEKDLDRE